MLKQLIKLSHSGHQFISNIRETINADTKIQSEDEYNSEQTNNKICKKFMKKFMYLSRQTNI